MVASTRLGAFLDLPVFNHNEKVSSWTIDDENCLHTTSILKGIERTIKVATEIDHGRESIARIEMMNKSQFKTRAKASSRSGNSRILTGLDLFTKSQSVAGWQRQLDFRDRQKRSTHPRKRKGKKKRQSSECSGSNRHFSNNSTESKISRPMRRQDVKPSVDQRARMDSNTDFVVAHEIGIGIVQRKPLRCKR